MARVHVLLGDSELPEIQQIAQDRQMTTEQWVREVLSEARRRGGRVEDKLEAMRKAVRHSFPTVSARPPQVRQEREAWADEPNLESGMPRRS
jgi:hypothetical protein